MIIEDEALAQELLEKYIRRVASLELVGTFDDAVDAFDRLLSLRPDIVFLDINMPEMTGIEFLRAYPAPHPSVVITTANPAHAIDGFELGVTDYLLKPVTFDRFMKAIGRVRGKSTLNTAAVNRETAIERTVVDFIYFKTDKKLEQVHFDQIVFAEALGDYVKVFLPDRFVVTLLTMKKLAETLPEDRFMRVHRSCIVQLRHIRTLQGNTLVTSTGQELVIGPNYRDDVKSALKNWLAS